jgi:alcohol dehydrogenase class IV
VKNLVREIGLGEGLSAYGVEERNLDALSEQAFADACHQTNPVPVSRADLRALYESAM